MCDDLFMPKKHDPVGKVRIALTLDVKGKTVFGGPGDCYRYQLSRTWDEKKPRAMFVVMNPSTADPLVNDLTVAKCDRFARAWGYGGIYVGNTFAYRATNKKHLRSIPDPIGPDNMRTKYQGRTRDADALADRQSIGTRSIVLGSRRS
jgi:hypothetical protein